MFVCLSYPAYDELMSKHVTEVTDTLFYHYLPLQCFKHCLLPINMELMEGNIKSLYFCLNILE